MHAGARTLFTADGEEVNDRLGPGKQSGVVHTEATRGQARVKRIDGHPGTLETPRELVGKQDIGQLGARVAVPFAESERLNGGLIGAPKVDAHADVRHR